MSIDTIFASIQDRIEASRGRGQEWWDSLNPKQQKDYIKKHPNSKYAKQGSSSSSTSEGPKVRGRKALQQKELKKRSATKNADAPKTRGRKATQDTKSKGPATKKRSTTKRAGRPKKVLTPREKRQKAKAVAQRIKRMEQRIKVLDTERSFRQAAVSYTQRDSTKERLRVRVKKIAEMKKTTQARIKKAQKRLQDLKG